MDFDPEMDSKITANDWKLVGGKQKMQPHNDVTQTPLPASQEHQNPTRRPPSTTQTTTAVTNVGPTLGVGNKTETENTFEKVNDHSKVEANQVQ